MILGCGLECRGYTLQFTQEKAVLGKEDMYRPNKLSCQFVNCFLSNCKCMYFCSVEAVFKYYFFYFVRVCFWLGIYIFMVLSFPLFLFLSSPFFFWCAINVNKNTDVYTVITIESPGVVYGV